ncbi:MAG: mannitol-1-phosphate 5-dehydrogenase [Romboutsia sp.]
MKKAIQFGAGNIGRGFIGALLYNAGYHVVFADVNEEILTSINNYKKYTILVRDVECNEIVVENISAVSSMSEDIIDEIVESSIITTAVGPLVLTKIAPTLAKGVQTRKNNGTTEKLNIIACENAVYASQFLKNEVIKYLNKEEIEYLNEYVGFPNCSVDRIVPPVKTENILDVTVEKFYEWNVEKQGFKGEIPEIEGMNLADNLMAYIERKLFTLNTGHAITAYLGHLKGLSTIEESIKEKYIRIIVKNAMIESGDGLIKKYKFDKDAHYKYIDKIVKRFENPYLNDDVIRVGREPLRKLSSQDRLIKPLLNSMSFGLPVDNLVLGISAALHYTNNEDKQSIELQEMIKSQGIKKALVKVTGLEENNTILNDIEKKYNEIAKIVKA